jgi:hypothetical protein
MGGACWTHMRVEKSVHPVFLWESQNERDHSEDRGVDRKRFDHNGLWRSWLRGEWNEFSWLRIGAGGGLLWVRWWFFGFWRHLDTTAASLKQIIAFCRVSRVFLIQWRTDTRFSVSVNAIHMHGHLIIFGPISRFYEPWYACNVVLCVVTNIWDERVFWLSVFSVEPHWLSTRPHGVITKCRQPREPQPSGVTSSMQL